MDFRYVYLSDDSNEKFRALLATDPGMFRNPLLATPDNFQSFMNLLDVSGKTTFVIMDKDQPAGLFISSIRGQNAYISSLAIAPNLRGQGYGRIVLEKGLSLLSESGCTSVQLEVLINNDAAIALYRDEGFTDEGVLSFYRNEQHSFHTPYITTGLTIDLSETELELQPLVRYFQSEEKPWQQQFRSLLLQLQFGRAELHIVKIYNQTRGYVITIPGDTSLQVLDIGVPGAGSAMMKSIITSLSGDYHVVQTYGFFEDDPQAHLLREIGFYRDRQQLVMMRKLR
jgi:ribosomal protein S18 acetylase RimI-like enzyme